MVFNTSEKVNISVQNVIINQVSVTKFLGIQISSDFKWSTQIESIIKNVNRGIFVLSQTSQVTDKNTNLLVFNAFTQSFISYGIIVWGREKGEKGLLMKLLRRQKKALRIVHHKSDRSASCRTLFKSYRILTVTSLYIYFSCIYARSKLSVSHHSYNTRHKTKCYDQNANSNSIDFISHSILCKIPDSIFKSTSMLSFKKQLKSFLLEHSFYSMDEFF